LALSKLCTGPPMNLLACQGGRLIVRNVKIDTEEEEMMMSEEVGVIVTMMVVELTQLRSGDDLVGKQDLVVHLTDIRVHTEIVMVGVGFHQEGDLVIEEEETETETGIEETETAIEVIEAIEETETETKGIGAEFPIVVVLVTDLVMKMIALVKIVTGEMKKSVQSVKDWAKVSKVKS